MSYQLALSLPSDDSNQRSFWAKISFVQLARCSLKERLITHETRPLYFGTSKLWNVSFYIKIVLVSNINNAPWLNHGRIVSGGRPQFDLPSHHFSFGLKLYVAIGNTRCSRKHRKRFLNWGRVQMFCKKNFDGILLIWSTKWNLFTKLFAQLGCKSRDESNDAN